MRDHKVFKFSYTSEDPEVYSAMNEVHRTGNFVKQAHTYSVLAPSKEIAQAHFVDRFKYSKNVEQQSVEVIEINAHIQLSY